MLDPHGSVAIRLLPETATSTTGGRRGEGTRHPQSGRPGREDPDHSSHADRWREIVRPPGARRGRSSQARCRAAGQVDGGGVTPAGDGRLTSVGHWGLRIVGPLTGSTKGSTAMAEDRWRAGRRRGPTSSERPCRRGRRRRPARRSRRGAGWRCPGRHGDARSSVARSSSSRTRTSAARAPATDPYAKVADWSTYAR